VEYFRIKNWKKFQHYKDRCPPWIKLHTELLYDVHGYLSLSDKAKLTLLHCWLAAGLTWNPEKEVEPLLPSSPTRLRQLIQLSFRITSSKLESAGYLIPVPNDYNNLRPEDASISLAENKHPREQRLEVREHKELKSKTSGNGEDKIPFSDIVDDFNEVARTSYGFETKEIRKLIKARWKDGYLFGDFEKVHRNMKHWAVDTKMREHYNPYTLYTEKFEKYLNVQTPKDNSGTTSYRISTKDLHPYVIDEYNAKLFKLYSEEEFEEIMRDDSRRDEEYGKLQDEAWEYDKMMRAKENDG